jgi:hypothetical protein
MNLVSKSNGLWATLGRFGLATNYQITAVDVENKILTVAEDVSGVFAEDDDLLIDSGTGVGQVFTVVSAVYDVDHTDITVTRTPLGVDVGDTLCFTRVPTDEDNVAVTHDIPGSTTTEIACNDLDLSGATVNFACSSASAITGAVKVGAACTFTYGTKQVGLKGSIGGETFSISSAGALGAIVGSLVGVSASLDALEVVAFSNGLDGTVVYEGAVKIGSTTHPIASGCLVSGAALYVDSIGGANWVTDGGVLQFGTARIGILAKDIRKGVADGTYCRGKGIPRPQPGARC